MEVKREGERESSSGCSEDVRGGDLWCLVQAKRRERQLSSPSPGSDEGCVIARGARTFDSWSGC